MYKFFRFLYLNTYSFLLLLCGAITVLIPLYKISKWLIVPQVIGSLFCIKQAIDLFMTWKDKKIKYNPYLYSLMNDESKKDLEKDNFELLGEDIKLSYDEYKEALMKNNYNNYTQIMQFPMNTKLIPPKPIVFDLTYEQFTYPNLEEKTKKQSKGLLGRTLGYWFGS